MAGITGGREGGALWCGGVCSEALAVITDVEEDEFNETNDPDGGRDVLLEDRS